MANLYKDADKRKKVKPGGVVEPEVEETVTEQLASEPPKVLEKEAEKKKPAEVVKMPANDILSDLIPKEKKPKGGTAGFYLSERVQNEIERLAKANKVSKSKYLETLLTRVFFGE